MVDYDASDFLIIYISIMILGLHPAKERRRHKVTLSSIGCAQT